LVPRAHSTRSALTRPCTHEYTHTHTSYLTRTWLRAELPPAAPAAPLPALHGTVAGAAGQHHRARQRVHTVRGRGRAGGPQPLHAGAAPALRPATHPRTHTPCVTHRAHTRDTHAALSVARAGVPRPRAAAARHVATHRHGPGSHRHGGGHAARRSAARHVPRGGPAGARGGGHAQGGCGGRGGGDGRPAGCSAASRVAVLGLWRAA
jgi:hypothetical protein